MFIGSSFPELNDKIRTGNYLLLPASTFEKVLSQFVIYIVGGLLVFVFLFLIDINLARWTVMQTDAVISSEKTVEPFSFSILWVNGIGLLYAICLGIGFFMFTARLFFKSRALIKSIVALIAFYFLCWQALSLLSHLFFPEQTEGFGHIATPDYKVMIIDGWNTSNTTVLFVCISLLICLVALPLAYFKLKEKEV
jgi:hypothetical protein